LLLAQSQSGKIKFEMERLDLEPLVRVAPGEAAWVKPLHLSVPMDLTAEKPLNRIAPVKATQNSQTVCVKRLSQTPLQRIGIIKPRLSPAA
jgi:hypothetical protein